MSEQKYPVQESFNEFDCFVNEEKLYIYNDNYENMEIDVPGLRYYEQHAEECNGDLEGSIRFFDKVLTHLRETLARRRSAKNDDEQSDESTENDANTTKKRRRESESAEKL